MLIKLFLLIFPVCMFSCRLVSVKVANEMKCPVRVVENSTSLLICHMIWEVLLSKRIRELNITFFCKWFWRLREKGAWVNLLLEKYGATHGGIYPKFSKSPIGCSLWISLKKVSELFKSIIEIKVGNRSNTSFWHDNWCTKFPLCRIFPSLSSINL